MPKRRTNIILNHVPNTAVAETESSVPLIKSPPLKTILNHLLPFPVVITDLL